MRRGTEDSAGASAADSAAGATDDRSATQTWETAVRVAAASRVPEPASTAWPPASAAASSAPAGSCASRTTITATADSLARLSAALPVPVACAAGARG